MDNNSPKDILSCDDLAEILNNIPKRSNVVHIKDYKCDNVIVPNEKNILNYLNMTNKTKLLNVHINESFTEEDIHDIFKSIISQVFLLETTNHNVTSYPQYVSIIFNSIKILCDRLPADSIFNDIFLFVKVMFHRYIVDFQQKQLIKIYNEMFIDGFYNNDDIRIMILPVLTEEWKLQQIKEYQEEVKTITALKNNKRPAITYEVGEIVGARDKTGKWLMAEVLKIATVDDKIVYYVQFKGWSDLYNEFISDPKKIAKYNPKKHVYFRTIWHKKNASKKSVKNKDGNGSSSCVERKSGVDDSNIDDHDNYNNDQKNINSDDDIDDVDDVEDTNDIDNKWDNLDKYNNDSDNNNDRDNNNDSDNNNHALINQKNNTNINKLGNINDTDTIDITDDIVDDANHACANFT